MTRKQPYFLSSNGCCCCWRWFTWFLGIPEGSYTHKCAARDLICFMLLLLLFFPRTHKHFVELKLFGHFAWFFLCGKFASQKKVQHFARTSIDFQLFCCSVNSATRKSRLFAIHAHPNFNFIGVHITHHKYIDCIPYYVCINVALFHNFESKQTKTNANQHLFRLRFRSPRITQVCITKNIYIGTRRAKKQCLSLNKFWCVVWT